jgi:hypothetical protein
MSMMLKPYPEYKDSGLPWLGNLPGHWKILRAKYIFHEIDERSTTGAETHLSMSQRYGLIDSSRIEGWRLQSESYIGGKILSKTTSSLIGLRLILEFSPMHLNPVWSAQTTLSFVPGELTKHGSSN